MYYCVEPEVPGGLGDNAQLDTSTHPPQVRYLHLSMDDWSGDDLLRVYPSYIVTVSLANQIALEKLSGFELGDVEVSKSDIFADLYSGPELPQFYWLKISGEAGGDDFGLLKGYRLVVSERVMKLLSAHKIENADVQEYVR